MAGYKSRDLGLNLKLGSSPVDLVSIDAEEGLSTHFAITLVVLSKLDDFDLLGSLGKPGSISVTDGEEVIRHFHGFVSEGEHIGEIQDFWQIYRVKLSPLALFHDQGRNFRIFQNKSIKDIISTVLEECKIAFKIKATGGTRQRAYCVQYGESDFAFVSRLLEEHGLYYYYNHTETGHELTICDQVNQIVDSSVNELTYNPEAITNGDAERLLEAGKGFVYAFTEGASSNGIAKVTFRDFDFKVPKAARESAAEQPSKHDLDQIEFFDWPGRYYLPDEGAQLTKFRIESLRAQRLTYRGKLTTAGVSVGRKIEVIKHDVSRLNAKYHVISSRVQIHDHNYRSAMGSGETLIEFVAIPLDTQFRAPMITPRPVVTGPETAIVTGPSGEEIYVDEFGRVKVHFHWDRLGRMDEKCSCWIRVSQTGGLGNIIHPRVGQEVLVEFINGDPDRPIIVGRIYNKENMPFYPLPADKTRSVWRTKTYRQTSGSSYSDAQELETKNPGANEIRFEDATGKEELFIHAEKDLNTRVRHFETHKVGGNVAIEVGKSRDEKVHENEVIKIGIDRTEDVGKNQATTIGINRSDTVGKDATEDVGNNQSITVGNKLTITVGSKVKIICGGSIIEMTPDKISLTSTTIETTAGAQTKITSGAKAEIVAGGNVKVMAAMINLN